MPLSYSSHPNRPSPDRHYSDSHSLLQSLIARKALQPGKQLHARLLLSGLGFDPTLVSKLVNFYANCNHLPYAHHLFDRIPTHNVFLWNVLIRGYAWNGPHEADNFTFLFILKACAALSALEAGREVHEHAAGFRWESDVFVAAGLVDMYAKCGCVGDAQGVFNRVLDRDAVLWNSMIAAYAQNGRPGDTLALCRDMVVEGFGPTVATLVIVVSASADAAALPRGSEIHGFSCRRGFESDDRIKTALVDMYAKSGWVMMAQRLFE